ncbi:hypothetical protein HIMB11_00658 [Rhodobacteraceae bacterium HIMB11]|nr:hypothetical protein HIMB11_00658 [Rhodobacteraceae bacterium HIMB11]
MTQHDQNQDAQLDDLFAAARRDAPEPSDAFMQALFGTIPEPNAATAVIEEPVSTGWWAGVRQTIADTFATRNIFSDASALTGVIAAGVLGVWIGVNGGDIGGISLNPFEAQGLDIVDPFSGLDLSYMDGGA